MIPANDPFILSRQVDLLYRNLRMGQIVSMINASFLTWIAFPFVKPSYLGMWWLLAVTVAGLRIAVAARFYATEETVRHSTSVYWRQRALIGSVISSVIWSAGTLLLMTAGDTILQLFTAFIMAGMVAGAVPVLAVDRLVFRSYGWPIILAVIIGAFGTDSLHMSFSAMALLFMAIATRSADHFHDTLQNTFRLEHEKDLLVEKLDHARQIAEKSDRMKTEFLANITHELRTPMNGIIGLGDLLNLEELTDDQRALLTPMRESADKLMHLISNLIQLSALEAGQVRLSPAPFVVGELPDSMLSSHRRLAAAKGLTLDSQQDSRLPEVLVGDTECLRKIFAHLIGNAIKFTEHGAISVHSRVVEQSANEVRVEFTVADSGPGIAADKLAHLDGLLVQADGSSVRKHEGIGVGLAIARRLIELMGGSLKITSEVGVGSRFSFTLPFTIGGAEHDSEPI